MILIAAPQAPLPIEFVEALLALFTVLTSSPSGGPAIVGAGLIPLIVQILGVGHPPRLPLVSKTTILLNNVLHGYGNAFQVFCNNGGVDALVNRIVVRVLRKT